MKTLWRLLVAALSLLMAIAAPAAEATPRALTLREAERLALQQNPDLASAQQRVTAARAALQQADAAFWPQVRLSENYAASDNPVQAFMMTLNQRAFNFGANFNHPDTTDNLNTKVLATYPLYNGGSDLASRQAARLGAEAGENSLEAVRNELVFEVARGFYTIGKARQFVRTAEAAVTSMESNLGVASNRFTQGTVLKSDFLDAEVRLSEARDNLVRARNALAISETVFRNVLGVGEKENVIAAESASKIISQAVDEPLDISQRPELLAAQKAVAASERRVRAAFGGHLPRVNAFASYDLDSGDARRYEDSWVAGVSVELDVFDGFLTRGKVAEARANLAAAREALRKTELALELEAKQAQLNLNEAQARLATTGQAVAQAKESLQITKERYANGLALLTQLLDAESALTAARQRRAAAEADDQIAQAALEKALGHGWKDTQ
ncbi:MAG TPA: TolC family protein [Verrucomicrobiae bacterium]|nr:TolC family protein [Verrucomicrobiae bacterium]